MISNYGKSVVCSHNPALSHIWTIRSKSALEFRLSDQKIIQSTCGLLRAVTLHTIKIAYYVSLCCGHCCHSFIWISKSYHGENRKISYYVDLMYFMHILNTLNNILWFEMLKKIEAFWRATAHSCPFFFFYIYKFGCFSLDDRTMIFLKNLVQEVRQVAFNLWRTRK